MLLAIDIGNTNIVIGIYQQGSWQHIWRLETLQEKGRIDYERDLRDFFLESGLKASQVQGAVLSSVVPALNSRLAEAAGGFPGQQVLRVAPEIYPHLPVKISNPAQMGTDLVANAVGAYQRFRSACVVVDFGTALTFTVIDDDGTVRGVSIAPGLKTAMQALSLNTAQLPDVPLELPASAIGTDTTTALQAGIMWGYAGLTSFMLEKIKAEMKKPVKVVATGGLSFVYKDLVKYFDFTDTNLTLEGLREIYGFVNSPASR